MDFSNTGYITLTSVAAQVTTHATTVLNESLSPALASGQIRIVLNWCDETPGAVRDIDSYLQVPGGGDPVYFYNKTASGAQLDVDETDWKGPETITITSLGSGTYSYYVNNYSYRRNRLALGSSSVRVSVYKGTSLLRTYAVPSGNGLTYEVFRIVNGTLTDVKAYNDSLSVAIDPDPTEYLVQ